MQLHSIALRVPKSSNQNYDADATRLNALIATLEACKRFLDTLLACPVSNYHVLAFTEWFRIPVVVITLARLCIPSDAHTSAQWDAKAAHERGRLDLYLESLCYRMKGLTTFKRTQTIHHDFYWAMEMIMDMTRNWFMKKISTKKTPSTGIPTPDSFPGSAHGSANNDPGVTSTPVRPDATNCPYVTLDQDPNFDGKNTDDPFVFMRDADFDMDKYVFVSSMSVQILINVSVRFFNAGLWGDETYHELGFGGGMRP